jgi:hypothetical protein
MNRIPPCWWAGRWERKKNHVSRASVEDASKKKKLVVLAAVCLAEAHWLEGGTRHRYVYLQNWGRRSTASNDASSSSSKWWRVTFSSSTRSAPDHHKGLHQEGPVKHGCLVVINLHVCRHLNVTKIVKTFWQWHLKFSKSFGNMLNIHPYERIFSRFGWNFSRRGWILL